MKVVSPATPPSTSGAGTVTPLTPQKDLSQVDPKLVEAAQGMEAMFLDYMYSVMRKTIPKNEMDLENSATKIYRSLLDSEMAQKAAKAGGVGLAEIIIENMESRGYNSKRKRESPPGTGGTE
jgi:Rod binding domain-containing protein